MERNQNQWSRAHIITENSTLRECIFVDLLIVTVYYVCSIFSLCYVNCVYCVHADMF